jgi:GH35 family endo-1,4-beta-xylanase
MRTTARSINPEDYILSVLSPDDRLDAAFKVAAEAFKKSKLTMNDIENAVKSVRKKTYEKKK